MSKRSRNQNASIMNNKNLTENKIIASLALQLTVNMENLTSDTGESPISFLNLYYQLHTYKKNALNCV